MKARFYLSHVILAGGLFLSSCSKDVSELPATTQTGANTFGAKVDGEFWTPQQFGPITANNLLEVNATGLGDFIIHARNFAQSPNESEFEIGLKHVTGTGTYLLNQNTGTYPNQSASYGYFVKRKLTPTNEWITSSAQTGSVELTRFDTAAHIISGTFQFNAGSVDNTANPIAVTEGRFDLKY